jgi:tRNA dimethylallyltransferase
VSPPRPARRRAVAIYGPTSSGKTALSLDLCEAASELGLRPVVLNADSRQVYVGMDIGTSKIKPPQMRGFEHRLLDVTKPSSKLSLEAYAQLARDELVALAAAEDALPVLVGGTGVYIRSVVAGWDLAGTGTLRRSLERDFPPSDVGAAYNVLTRLAPESARRVHPNNYDAILNAVVPQTRRVAGRPSISGENHRVASAVTRHHGK